MWAGVSERESKAEQSRAERRVYSAVCCGSADQCVASPCRGRSAACCLLIFIYIFKIFFELAKMF